MTGTLASCSRAFKTIPILSLFTPIPSPRHRKPLVAALVYTRHEWFVRRISGARHIPRPGAFRELQTDGEAAHHVRSDWPRHGSPPYRGKLLTQWEYPRAHTLWQS